MRCAVKSQECLLSAAIQLPDAASAETVQDVSVIISMT